MKRGSNEKNLVKKECSLLLAAYWDESVKLFALYRNSSDISHRKSFDFVNVVGVFSSSSTKNT